MSPKGNCGTRPVSNLLNGTGQEAGRMVPSRMVGYSAAAILAGGIIAAGCAQRTQSTGASRDLFALTRARELVQQGCYDCLLDARDAFERLGAGPTTENIPLRRFEVELLLALREKELALDATASLTRARVLLATLPDARQAEAIVELVAAIASDAAGTPQRERDVAPGLRSSTVLAEALERLRLSPMESAVRAYVAAAASCGSVSSFVPPALERPEDAAIPLVAYRRAICRQPIDAEALALVRARVPRFVEAALFQARHAMTVVTDGAAARQMLEVAYARFRTSPAVTYQYGMLLQTLGDRAGSVDRYSETLGLRDAHEGARLGRALCLSYLNRPDEAIADATLLIDRQAYNRGEAFYWRAFNRHRLKDYTGARADIDAARALIYNSRVLTLAGIIESDQNELASARADLTKAGELDAWNCQAPWYLAVVEFKAQAWRPSAVAFAAAGQCYARSIAKGEHDRAAALARVDLDPAFITAQVAGFDAAIKEDRAQQSASDLNAAMNYARAGDTLQAAAYADRAAADPERSEAVLQLRKLLETR